MPIPARKRRTFIAPIASTTWTFCLFFGLIEDLPALIPGEGRKWHLHRFVRGRSLVGDRNAAGVILLKGEFVLRRPCGAQE